MEAFGIEGDIAPSALSMEVMLELAMGKLEPKAVSLCSKEVTQFVNWMSSLRVELDRVGSILRCSYLRMVVLKLVVVTPDGKSVKSKHQAPALPVDSVIALEDLVSSAHTLPVRVHAGIACLCVHGVKRWSDAQHVGDVGSTEDAI